MQKKSGNILFSPSDLITFVKSPYAAWMDRHYLENPGAIKPDEPTGDQSLIAETGDRHERSVLDDLKKTAAVVEIEKSNLEDALAAGQTAIAGSVPVIYQAALQKDQFAGFSDFLILGDDGRYQIWDTKLARSPKPYFLVQLCCYSEMLEAVAPGKCSSQIGVILGTRERVEYRIEDFVHYYRRVKRAFLELQASYDGDLAQCPEPLAGADHGRWTSYAEKYFDDTDHLVRVAGITVGQIKKLRASGIATMEALAASAGRNIPKLAKETFEKLVAQARLQCATRRDRKVKPDVPAHIEILPAAANGQRVGLAALPKPNANDVFFDMEGYPLADGGLEYLFGACTRDDKGEVLFNDWWAHNRAGEKQAFEAFVDWVYARWKASPGMHIYHYAAYEVSAIRRLSTQHDSRQDEVDQLLRNEVFVDLYQVVRHGLRIGEDSYSIKAVERLYRPKRITEVSTALDSVVQYANWIESGESPNWRESQALQKIREYNYDDCLSTVELYEWLRAVAAAHKVVEAAGVWPGGEAAVETKELSPEAVERLKTIVELRKNKDDLSAVLADVLDYHRREDKPMWWRMFDRAVATAEELRDDSGCIEGVGIDGVAVKEKRSLVQAYRFDSDQECKLSHGEKKQVMFTHDLKTKFNLPFLDADNGVLKLKLGESTLKERFDGAFPAKGSLQQYEFVDPKPIQVALTEIGKRHLDGELHGNIEAFIKRQAPADVVVRDGECTSDAAIRIASAMKGGCLVIQGPPGTGKTYSAAKMIAALIKGGKRVGVTSNGHKAVLNLIRECGEVMKKAGQQLVGIKVGGDNEDQAFKDFPRLAYVPKGDGALGAYQGGIVGGTAWLFSLPEWEGALDYLFIDEAGQVSLANAIAVARSASNIVLLGDQMQLEQPTEGCHPGDSGLSCLQYALKDTAKSRRDAPVFHAVVPAGQGLFLGESRRMHPSVCRLISESIYEGRLGSHASCANQKIALDPARPLISIESGIVFLGIEHDGNIQQSDEEVAKAKAVLEALKGRAYTDADGITRALELNDFLFIAPYNAQVRALQSVLPAGSRVASVDKFQGQQAPVCILSLCSSYGEYGSRGLKFILDKNRVNVAISRAQCLAIVIADPRIAAATASTLPEMALLNLFCKITDTAG